MLHAIIPQRKSWAWSDVLREGDVVEFDARSQPLIRVYSQNWQLEMNFDGVIQEKGRSVVDGSSLRKRMSHVKNKSGFEWQGMELIQDQQRWLVEKSNHKSFAIESVNHYTSLIPQESFGEVIGLLGLYKPESDWHAWRSCIQVITENQMLTFWHSDGYSVHAVKIPILQHERLHQSIPVSDWQSAVRFLSFFQEWSIGLHGQQLIFKNDFARLAIKLHESHLQKPIFPQQSIESNITWGPVPSWIDAPTKKEPDRKKQVWIRAESEWMNALRSHRDQIQSIYEDIWIRFVHDQDLSIQVSQNLKDWETIYTQSSNYTTTYVSVPFRSHYLLKGLYKSPDVQFANWGKIGLEIHHMVPDHNIQVISFWLGCN